MKKLFSILGLMLVLGSCGAEIKGEIRVVHSVEISSIKELLEMACGEDITCQQQLLFAILDDIGGSDDEQQ